MDSVLDHVLDLAARLGPAPRPGSPVPPARPPAGRPRPPLAQYDFVTLLSALRALLQAPPAAAPEVDAALLDVVRSRGTISLAPGSLLPHGMPPEDLVRIIAAQHLLRRDWQQHHGDVEQLAAEAPNATFRRMIQADLDALRR